MSRFDEWRRWAAGLTDAEFATVWLALGVAAANDPHDAFPGVAVTAGDAGGSERASAAAHRLARRLASPQQVVVPYLPGSLARSKLVAWRFPSLLDALDLEGTRFSELDARGWARAWASASRGVPRIPKRVRIHDPPAAEPILPWLRPLRDALTTSDALSLAFTPPQPHLVLDWPLRLGHWAGSSAAEALALGTATWPGSRLARVVSLDRDQSNCDVLVHEGGTDTLLAALLASPLSVEANLVVVRGALDGNPITLDQRIRAIASECRASGVVLDPAARSSEEFGAALN